MFHRFFTTQELSSYFRKASILSIICLLAILLQNHYLPDHQILEQIIEIVSHISLVVTALIVISQAILLFNENHQKFVTKHKIVALIIEVFLTAFVFWLLAVTHHIKGSFIKFYSSASIAPDHSEKIIYLLIFIFIMLIIDLYKAIKENKKITDKSSVKEFFSEEIHLLIRQYLIIFASIFGLLHFKGLHEFAMSARAFTQLTFIVYAERFCDVMLILLATIFLYCVYKFYCSQKNKL